MQVRRVLVPLLLTLALAGCDSKSSSTMPDVVGQKLDVALSHIERAGITEDPEVLGGGVFGVVDKSSWQVCEQLPAAGQSVDTKPRLTVDRSCGGESESSEQSESTQSEIQPTVEPPTESTLEQNSPTESTFGDTLTVENNSDFASLVTLTDQCSPEIESFAHKYPGRTVKFDGSIGAMGLHGKYKSRYDILIGYGDFNEASSPGPSFQLRDVNVISDLGWAGEQPDHIGVGDDIRLTATVGPYESSSCLFRLDPISTEIR